MGGSASRSGGAAASPLGRGGDGLPIGWDPGVSAVVRGGCASGLAIRVLGRWNRACDRRKGDRNRSGIGQVTHPPPAIPKRWAFFRRTLASGFADSFPEVVCTSAEELG